MAGSRLEKLGTIFTRVRGLLSSGVMPEAKKPIWYEVYAAFPPVRDPVYQDPNPEEDEERKEDPIRPILYPEDRIRAYIGILFPSLIMFEFDTLYSEMHARWIQNWEQCVVKQPQTEASFVFFARKFYKVYGNGPKAFELSKRNFKSTSQMFVEKYHMLEQQGGVDEDRLFEETAKALMAQGVLLRKQVMKKVEPPPPRETQGMDAALKVDIHSVLSETEGQPQGAAPEPAEGTPKEGPAPS